jgi:hypothetical protein
MIVQDIDKLCAESQLSNFIGVLKLLHNMNLVHMTFQVIIQNVAKTSV